MASPGSWFPHIQSVSTAGGSHPVFAACRPSERSCREDIEVVQFELIRDHSSSHVESLNPSLREISSSLLCRDCPLSKFYLSDEQIIIQHEGVDGKQVLSAYEGIAAREGAEDVASPIADSFCCSPSISQFTPDPYFPSRIAVAKEASLAVYHDYVELLSYDIDSKCLGFTSLAHVLVCGEGRELVVVDLRQNSESLRGAGSRGHMFGISSLACNLENPVEVVTGGRDGRLCLWDVRSFDRPLLKLSAHSHEVLGVQMNPVYPEVVLSWSLDESLLVSHWPEESSQRGVCSPCDRGVRKTPERAFASLMCSDSDPLSACWSEGSPWDVGVILADGSLCLETVGKKERHRVVLGA